MSKTIKFANRSIGTRLPEILADEKVDYRIIKEQGAEKKGVIF